MINGITFDNQIVTAQGIRSAFSGIGDGILDGCEVSASGNTVTIGAGAMIAAGGAFRLTSAESVTVSGSSGYARIKAVINTNGTATSAAFSQVSFVVDTAASLSGFADLVQENINKSGSKYEIEVATVSLSASGISGIARKCGLAKANISSDMMGSSLPSVIPPAGYIFYKIVG